MYYAIHILSCLMNGPCYGYEIKKRIQQIEGACVVLSNNAIYPLLRAYEKQGAAEKTVEVVEGKPNRIIYSITPIGHQLFADTLRCFPDALMMSREEFFIRLLYFKFLNIETRKRTLELRKAFLQNSTDILERNEAEAGLLRLVGDMSVLANYHAQLNALEFNVIAQYEAKIDMPCCLTDDGYIIEDTAKNA